MCQWAVVLDDAVSTPGAWSVDLRNRIRVVAAALGCYHNQRQPVRLAEVGDLLIVQLPFSQAALPSWLDVAALGLRREPNDKLRK
jgi:hypothetical protein